MLKGILWNLLFILSGIYTFGQRPLVYWTFDGVQYTTDQTGRRKIDISSYKGDVQHKKGQVGMAIASSGLNGLIATSLFTTKPCNTDYTIEFLFKGEQFIFTTFPAAEFRITFGYSSLNVNIQVKNGPDLKKYDWQIPLNGAGIISYNNLANGTWHHYVFTLKKSGELQFWIDGESDPLLQKKIEPFDELGITVDDCFKIDGSLDELAFYQVALTPDLIWQHAVETNKGLNYSFSKIASLTGTRRQQQKPETNYDPKEFAPGYPNYTIQATDQLKAFPDPRFSSKTVMKRNFPWLDITYLHRELPGPGGKGFGKVSSDKAVELMDEMVRRWNYYIELPCLRQDSTSANKVYSDPASVPYAMIQYARKHPEFPTASVIMQGQGKPRHAGFSRDGSFVTAQDLQDRYYLKDDQGKVVIYNGQKWLSPLAPLDIIKNDAKTTAFYLRQLTKFLGRPIDMLNENGEVFGHMRPKSLLERDPAVKKDIELKGLSIPQYNGWFQNRLDTCYKNEILRALGWKSTLFTFYDVSAYNSTYWPGYDMRRSTNSVINGIHYSTPSFYPYRPDNWRIAAGSLNGYGTVAEGRLKEIKMGDKLFAPFISAGWGFEENNIRPAQWLALLKAMVMLGADFFHVGYFNVTDQTGWPNGAGPNDPRGYAYQVAMPAYAQAIESQVRDIITKGQLLNPVDPNDKFRQFRFAGKTENELILVRKLGKEYLIYGSIQPSSNIKGNVPFETITEINLEGRSIRFPIRKQGSMYILNLSGSKPVFYQVDSWHEYTHPWYWSKNTEIEAELPDNTAASGNIYCDHQDVNGLDFSNNTAYFSFQSKLDKPQYIFRQRQPGVYYCYLRARIKNGKEAELRIHIQGNRNWNGSVTVKGSSWQWYQVKADNLGNALKFSCSDGMPTKLILELTAEHAPVDVDKQFISTDGKFQAP